MAGRNLELRPREEGTRDKAKIPVVRFPLDKITEHFQETSVAAAEIEHPMTRLDQIRDNFQVVPQFEIDIERFNHG